jgi:hypothetical protein
MDRGFPDPQPCRGESGGPETSDGFRRRFGLGFGKAGITDPLHGCTGRQLEDSDNGFAGLHLGVFPFAVCLEDFRFKSRWRSPL